MKRLRFNAKVGVMAFLASAWLNAPAGIGSASVSPGKIGGWQLLPVYGGGFMQGVEICLANPNRWYSYADVSGPFRSDDGGKSWVMLQQNMPAGWKCRKYSEVRSLSVDPRNPDSFVMCGGDCWSYSLGAILVSRDGGKSFREVQRGHFYGGSPRRLAGRSLDRDPFNPDILVAGEDGDGIFLSKDNGEHWREMGLKGPWFTDVRFDRRHRGRIWATAPEWFKDDKDRRPGGFWRSDDYGEHWQKLPCEPPTELCQPSNSDIVVGIFGSAKRFYATSDGGMRWKPYSQGLPEAEAFPTRAWDEGAFDAIGAGSDFFVASDACGNYWRRNVKDPKWTRVPNGKRHFGVPAAEIWEEKNLKSMLCVSTVYVDPARPEHWLSTDWYDIWETEDGGKNWTTRVNGIQQLVPFEIACDPLSESNLTYVVADIGVESSRDGGKSYQPKLPVRTLTSAAYSHKTPGLIYTLGARWEAHFFRSEDAGITWKEPALKGLPKRMYHAEIAPFMVSVHPITDDVYITMGGPVGEGKGGIYRSHDRGESWEWFGKGLPTGEKLFKDCEFGYNEGPEILFSSDGSAALAMARVARKIYRLDVAAGEWKLAYESKKDPFRSAFADNFAPGRFVIGGNPVMETTDGGLSFHPLPGEGSMDFFNVAGDPHTPGLMVFSGYDSMWVSYDSGKTKRKLENWFEEIPTSLSRKVTVDRKRVFYLTNGCGVWERSLK